MSKIVATFRVRPRKWTALNVKFSLWKENHLLNLHYCVPAVDFSGCTKPPKQNTKPMKGLHWDVPRAHGWCTVAIGGLKCWYRRAKPSVDWDCNKGKAWPETFTKKWQVADLSHTFSQTNKPQMVANDLNIGETRVMCFDSGTNLQPWKR